MRNLAETLITAAKVAWVGLPTDQEIASRQILFADSDPWDGDR